jgi:DNA polymerase I
LTLQRRKLFLIDGMSCAYRAFYAIRDLRTSSGEPTNAVYGFTNMLLKLVRERKPDAIAVVFDSATPTFRHERFEAYKAHRKPMPEDLLGQLPLIKEVIEAYRIMILQRDGLEADDLMGSLAVAASRSGYDVYLVTSDKDMLQLVRSGISVFRPDSGEIYDEDAVMRRYGVEPGKVVDVLALAGDASDNIPGVPGIGEKTAIELVREFGDLEGVLGNMERVKGEKRRENLKRFADQARLSRELVTLKGDVPLEFGPDECLVRSPDRNRISALFRRFEFRKLHAEVAGGAESGEKAYACVTDAIALEELASALAQQEAVSMNLETTGGDPMSADPVGVSFSWRPGEGFYVPLNGGLAPEKIMATLRPVLENPAVRKIGQNIKYDMLVLRRCGVELRGVSFDTMLAAYLLNPSQTTYGLADLALEYLDMRLTPISDLIGAGKKQISMRDVPLKTVCDYACADADVTLRLCHLMRPRLEEQGMWGLFQEVEMPLVGVLAEMEAAGVRIDTALLERLSGEIGAQLDELEKSIYEMAGEPFNINSPAQLGRVLFERLKLPASRKIKTGHSTDYDALLKLSKIHPLPSKLLEYRQLNKLKTTYVDALPRMVNPRTGRIHTSFNQAGTATGRLSSSDPNLQNIPVRTELGRRIREAFIPGSEGMVLLSADYSQIDLRILAHLSGDRELMEAFRRDEDIHTRTAAALFDVEPARVTPEMRRQAKTVNFGIVYGMSAYGLARELGIEPPEAQRVIDRYFEHYCGLRDYIEKSLVEATERGYVSTMLNRRRAVPELTSRSQSTRDLGRRIAINTPIQGSSADLIKIAMREIAKELREGRWRAAMLIQIHDELLFEVASGQAQSLGDMVSAKMEGVWKLNVPIRAHVKTGKNWGEL